MDADWYSVNGDDEWFNEDNSFPSLEIVVDTNNNNNHTLNWEDFFEDNKIIQFTNLPPSDCKHADRKQKSHAFNRQDQQSTVSFSGRMKVGYFPNAVIDLANQVKAYGNSQYSFVVCPIVDPNNSIFEPICDLHLTSQDWMGYIIGYVYCDQFVQNQSTVSLISAQIDYCVHLGLKIIVVECPFYIRHIPLIAQIINSKYNQPDGPHYPKILIHIKIDLGIQHSMAWRKKNESHFEKLNPSIITDTWEYYNLFRSLCVSDERLGVALELNGDLPDSESLLRWQGEQVKMILISTNQFLLNKKQYPVLPRAYQHFISQIAYSNARKVHIVVKGHHCDRNLFLYSSFIEHFSSESDKLYIDDIANFARGYEDYLQNPLQPLQDNLETSTYEIFEKDPVKYCEYSQAISMALKKFPQETTVIVLLVGAGRGPLIRAALKSATDIGRSIHLYAVEKNPHAIITLRAQLANFNSVRSCKVEVISSDIRDWMAPQLADIVVSELLGSFGDNELSPECLDSVWKCVKDTAISIPESYRSWIAPIMSPKLHAETAALRDKPFISAFDCTYVVYIRNHYLIDSPKELFSFVHDKLTEPPNKHDNSRHKTLTFTAKINCACHGFAGFFDTTLYENISLSIVTGNHTPKMFSWFPVWIPLEKPVQLKQGEKLEVHFWRKTNIRAVWYEWCLIKPIPTQIQNSSGKSHSIGLL